MSLVSPENQTADQISVAVDEWNTLADEVGLSKVQKVTAARRKAINARLKDVGGLDGWMYALGKVRSSPGLQGKAGNGRKWKANFDWLTKEANMVKVVEGQYDQWTASGCRQSAQDDYMDIVDEIQQTAADGSNFGAGVDIFA